MKILHTSDWHLGRVLYSHSLLSEQQHFVEDFFLPLVEREKPDLVILAGDIFDRKIAPVEAIRLFDQFVTYMCADLSIPLAVITGNHDGADRISIGSRLLADRGLYLVSRLEQGLTPFLLKDDYGPIQLWMLPYFDPAMARDAMNDPSIEGFGGAYKAVLDDIRQRMDPAARQILVAHCFVAGSSVSDSESPLYIGGSGEVDAGLFAGFHYVALGHLHAPQYPRPFIRYAGSPLKYSFDEEHQRKSVSLVQLTDKLSVKDIPVTGVRDVRTVTGTLEELLAQSSGDTHRDDFIYAYLTDEGPVFEPMARLREGYPNILGLESNWLTSSTVNVERRDLRESLRKQGTSSDFTIFSSFLAQVCGTQADAQTEELFRAIYRETLGEEAGT